MPRKSTRKASKKMSVSGGYYRKGSIGSKMSISRRGSSAGNRSAIPVASTPAEIKKSIQTCLLSELRIISPSGVPKPLNEELTTKVEGFLQSSNKNFVYKRLDDEELAEKQKICKDFSSTFGQSIKKATSLLNNGGMKLPREGVLCLSGGQTRRNGGVPVYYFFAPPDVQQFKWALDGTITYENESGGTFTIRKEQADDLSVAMYKRTHGDNAVFEVIQEPKGGLKQYPTSRSAGTGVFCDPPIKKIDGFQVRVVDFKPDVGGSVEFAEIAFSNDTPGIAKGFLPVDHLEPFIEWTELLYKLLPENKRDVVLLSEPRKGSGLKNHSGTEKLTLRSGVIVNVLQAKDGFTKVNVQSQGGPRGHRASVVGRSGWVKSSALYPFNGDSEALAKYGVSLDKTSPKCKKCSSKFGTFNPRRNCRVCGGAFCKKCSPRTKTINGHENKPICIDCDAATNETTQAAHRKTRDLQAALARANKGAGDALDFKRRATLANNELSSIKQQLVLSKKKVEEAEEKLRKQTDDMEKLKTEKEDALAEVKAKEKSLKVAQKTLQSSSEGRMRRLAQAQEQVTNLEQDLAKKKTKFKAKYKELFKQYEEAEGAKAGLEAAMFELEEESARDKEDLESELADVQAECDGLTSALSSAEKRLAKMKAQLSAGNTSASKQLKDEISELTKSLKAAEKSKKENSKKLGDAERKLKGVEQQLENGKNNHGAKLEALQDKLTAANERKVSAEKEIANLQEEKDALECKMRAQIEDLGTKIDNLTRQLKDTENEKSALSKKISKLKVDWAEEKLKLTNQALKNMSSGGGGGGVDVEMQVKMRMTEKELSQANAKKDELTEELKSLEKKSKHKQEQLETEVETLDKQTGMLKTDLASERKKVGDLEEELEKTKKEVVKTTSGPGLFRIGDDIKSTKSDGLRKGKRGKLLRFDESKSKWLVKWNNVKTPGFYSTSYMAMLDQNCVVGPKKGVAPNAEDVKKLQRQLDQFRQTESRMRDTESRLTRELGEAEEELEEVKAQFEQVEKELKHIKNTEIRELKKQLESYKDSMSGNAADSAKLTDLTAQLEESKQNLESLTKDLQASKEDKTKVMEEKIKLAQEKLELQNQMLSGDSGAKLAQMQMQTDLAQAKKSKEEADAKVEVAQEEKAALEKKMQAELAGLGEAKSVLEKQLADTSSNEDLTKANQTIAELNDKLSRACACTLQ